MTARAIEITQLSLFWPDFWPVFSPVIFVLIGIIVLIIAAAEAMLKIRKKKEEIDEDFAKLQKINERLRKIS